MSKIGAFNAIKAARVVAHDWADKIGRYYEGGRGGTGRVVRASFSTLVVYHQPYDGATNYHDAPACLKPYLDAALLKASPEIIKSALAAMKADEDAAASAAVAEHAELMRAVGLVAP